ncbi:MAG: hypothetical protein ACI4GO_09050 [Hominenteromicrobium sp.]
MEKKSGIVKKSFWDGALKGLLFYLLGKYAFSVFALDSLQWILVLAAGCGLFSNVFFIIHLRKEKKNKRIALYFLCGILWLVLFAAAVFIIYMMVSVHLFPIRTLNAADGMVYLLVQGVFFGFCGFGHFCAFLLFVIRNMLDRKKHQEENTGRSV